MQHLYYLSSGNFIPTKRELLECVQDEDKSVLELSISLQNCTDYDFDKAFSVFGVGNELTKDKEGFEIYEEFQPTFDL